MVDHLVHIGCVKANGQRLIVQQQTSRGAGIHKAPPLPGGYRQLLLVRIAKEAARTVRRKAPHPVHLRQIAVPQKVQSQSVATGSHIAAPAVRQQLPGHRPLAVQKFQFKGHANTTFSPGVRSKGEAKRFSATMVSTDTPVRAAMSKAFSPCRTRVLP